MNNDKEMQIQAAQKLLGMRGKVIQISDISDISALCLQAKADILFEYNSTTNEFKILSLFYLGFGGN